MSLENQDKIVVDRGGDYISVPTYQAAEYFLNNIGFVYRVGTIAERDNLKELSFEDTVEVGQLPNQSVFKPTEVDEEGRGTAWLDITSQEEEKPIVEDLNQSLLNTGLLPSGTEVSNTPPLNVNNLWLDTSLPKSILKKFNGTSWEKVSYDTLYSNQSQLQTSNRIYCYTNNRWVAPNNQYGFTSEQLNSNKNTAAEPSYSWQDKLFAITKGTKINKVDFFGRSNNTQLSGLECRVYFHTGPWDVSWDSNTETQRTLLYSSANLFTQPTNDNKRASAAISFEAPDDGFLVTYFKPIGTLSGTRYFYMTQVFSITTPRL